MKRAVFVIAAPVMLVCLCGAAAARAGSLSPGALFAQEPTHEFSQPVAQTAAVMRETGSGEGSSGPEYGLDVTSDSRAYCVRLMRSIDEHEKEATSTVMTLRHEGQRLCAEGYVRVGVTRLREALAILKGRNIRK
ncbi:hypothetical protein [Acetobacter conturbans]|uniref:UrcA family protein n=1 Tax=Acetobacter conturbans TaxID=1737472 RepID=A0ABX0K2L9_9PROT|nr:hypothetical protein [Acetobacter conturbans]NHN88915.1 hypothetical protein [Acetobacter conturbans]